MATKSSVHLQRHSVFYLTIEAAPPSHLDAFLTFDTASPTTALITRSRAADAHQVLVPQVYLYEVAGKFFDSILLFGKIAPIMSVFIAPFMSVTSFHEPSIHPFTPFVVSSRLTYPHAYFRIHVHQHFRDSSTIHPFFSSLVP